MQYQFMLMFPGVGSHHTGMGKTFYDHFPTVRDLFVEASDILHCDMYKLCFSAESAGELEQLKNSQVALLCVSVATYKVLVEETGLEQAVYLGYSLGEYSALCCAGALSLQDALQLVRERGVIVTETVAAIEGSMIWVVNLQSEKVEQICQELRQEKEDIFISAYDSPVKTSLSGTQSALRRAGEKVVEAGGIPIPIKMSGPFHSPLMHAAADRFRPLLKQCTYNMPKFPVISNFTASPYGQVEAIAENLTLQLINPIHWQKSLELTFNYGVNTSIEVGPKDVLTYVLKENRKMRGYTLATKQSLIDFQSEIKTMRSELAKFLAKALAILSGTRNYNEDLQEYEEQVFSRTKKIQAIYEQVQAGKLFPDAGLCQKVIAILTEALHAKKLPESEVATHIKKLLDMSCARTPGG